jgi:hypothetical protein
MNLVRLTPDYVLTAFDCGDSDLNEFLMEDASSSMKSVLQILSSLKMKDVLLPIFAC